MSQSRNVITKQRRMHNYIPLFVITKYHTPQHSIYINNRTNQEQTTQARTKQEQLKKESL